jgi:hypothetical protein
VLLTALEPTMALHPVPARATALPDGTGVDFGDEQVCFPDEGGAVLTAGEQVTRA